MQGLQNGNIIVLDLKGQYVFIRLGSGDGTIVKWSNGDDKMSVGFIKNDTDFWTFSTIIADTHGMKIEPCDDFEENYGPAYRFVK